MLTEMEKKILIALNENARKSFRQVAKEVSISATAAYYKVKKLERSGVIDGYIPLINEKFLGNNLTVIIGLRVNQGKEQLVQEEVSKLSQVRAVFDITGDWDFFLVCSFKGRDDLNHFLKNELSLIPVERAITYIVLNVVKEEKRYPVLLNKKT